MMAHIRETSPRLKARIAGVFYLLSVLMAVFAEALVHGRMLYVVGLVPVACFTVVTLALYHLFKPMSRMVSLLAAFINLVSLALEALELHFWDINAALAFHGFYCVLIGWLAFRSSFLPRILGVLITFGGIGWLVSLSPPFNHASHVYSQVLGFFGEGLLMLWLLVMGVSDSENSSTSQSIEIK